MIARFLNRLALAASVATSPAWSEPFMEEPEDDLGTAADVSGGVDMSGFLARGGFVPIPIIVTDPAFEGGLGLMLQFARPGQSGGSVLTRTVIGYVRTGNDSEALFFGRSGGLRGGDLRYRLGFGVAGINLAVYPGGGAAPLNYRNESKSFGAALKFRLGEGDSFLGPRLVVYDNDLSVGTGGALPPSLPLPTFRENLIGAGLIYSYDSRDNAVSPRSGINLVAKADRYDGAIGSDRDFSKAFLGVHGFQPLGRDWTVMGKLIGEAASDSAPFYSKPALNLRGVRRNRYQGDGTVSAEIELRRDFSTRWAGVAFAGYGRTYGDSTLFPGGQSAATGGVGLRYKIAETPGIDIGLDVATGPEETIFYVQFGHAWGRTMD